MTFTDLRIGWRQLLAEPAYSAVVVLGLGLALAVTYLIALLLVEDWLPDPQIPAPDRVVSVEFKGNIPGRDDDWFSGAPLPFGEALANANTKAPVTEATRVYQSALAVRAGGQIFKSGVLFADPDLVAMFGFRAEQGELKDVMQRPDRIAVMHETALRWFGRADVIGRTVRIQGKDVTVGAVVAPQKWLRWRKVDALAGFRSSVIDMPEQMQQAWYMISGNVYARLAPGATPEGLSGLLQHLFDDGPAVKTIPPEWSANGRHAAFLRATPLSQLAFKGARNGTQLLMEAAVGLTSLLMLLVAAINYVNLTTVRALRRQREIGLRKSLGAGPGRLVLQFLVESCLVAVLAGAVGLLLAWWLAPALQDLVQIEIVPVFWRPAMVASLFALCALLGVATGLYPARVALHIQCGQALQGRQHSEGRGGRQLRRALTAVQFAAAIALSGVALVLMWQNQHVAHLDRGFRTDGVVAIAVPDAAPAEVVKAFREALARDPAVRAVTLASDVPGRSPIGFVTTVKRGTQSLNMRSNSVDPDFFRVYRVPVLAGRVDVPPHAVQPGPELSVVIDATAARLLGFASPQAAVGAAIKEGPMDLRIVGVVGRVKQESARQHDEPQLFHYPLADRNVLSAIGPDLAATKAAALRLWPRYLPDDVPDIDTADHLIGQVMWMDHVFATLIAAASLLALALASFGIYALSAYTVRRNTMQLVIRKLHGAGARNIAAHLGREFMPLLGVGALVGLPLAAWVGQVYLADFVDRAPMGLWPGVLALGVTATIAALATLRHALQAMRLRPVLALQG
jgi:putative ABC transport system permease protein